MAITEIVTMKMETAKMTGTAHCPYCISRFTQDRLVYKVDDYSCPQYPEAVSHDGPRNYGHGDKYGYEDN